MQIVYMGTPDFAVGPLEALIAAGHRITAVVTQPDKPRGRGKEMAASPVKECALKYGIPVLTPVKIKTAEAVAQLKEYPADIFVVAAFGQILSEEILNLPRCGCINIHASLLPKYRGAAPIQRCIIDGETETGVTIMQMDKGLDTGDILFQKRVPISPQDTGESLFEKLSAAGSSLITEALERIEKNDVHPVKQDEAKSSYAAMLTKASGKIDWNKSAGQLERLVRGLNSWPSAYTFYQGKQLKIWKARVLPEAPEKSEAANAQDTPEASEKSGAPELPGTVIRAAKDQLIVRTGEGALAILELQLEGKKRMSTEEFLRGRSVEEGSRLG